MSMPLERVEEHRHCVFRSIATLGTLSCAVLILGTVAMDLSTVPVIFATVMSDSMVIAMIHRS